MDFELLTRDDTCKDLHELPDGVVREILHRLGKYVEAKLKEKTEGVMGFCLGGKYKIKGIQKEVLLYIELVYYVKADKCTIKINKAQYTSYDAVIDRYKLAKSKGFEILEG